MNHCLFSINGLPIFKYFAQKQSPTESDVSNACRQLGSALQHIHELNIAHLAIKVCRLFYYTLISLTIYSLLIY